MLIIYAEDQVTPIKRMLEESEYQNLNKNSTTTKFEIYKSFVLEIKDYTKTQCVELAEKCLNEITGCYSRMLNDIPASHSATGEMEEFIRAEIREAQELKKAISLSDDIAFVKSETKELFRAFQLIPRNGAAAGLNK